MQSPDEPVHVYYVQYLAETGKVPRPGPTDTKSEEEQTVEAGVHRADIVANFFGRPLWTDAEAERLRRSSSTRGLDRVGGGGDAGVGGYPPLYYAALVVPYKLVVVRRRRPARPPERDAARLGAVRRDHRAVRDAVPARAAAAPPLGVGHRRPGLRADAVLRVHRRLGQPGRRDRRRVGRPLLLRRAGVPRRADARRGGRAGAGDGRRVPDQAVGHRAAARGGARHAVPRAAPGAARARRRAPRRWRSPPRAPRCR